MRVLGLQELLLLGVVRPVLSGVLGLLADVCVGLGHAEGYFGLCRRCEGPVDLTLHLLLFEGFGTNSVSFELVSFDEGLADLGELALGFG